MNIRLILRTLLLVGALSMSMALVVVPARVSAEACPSGSTPTGDPTNSVPCKCPDGQQLITQAVDSSGNHCVPINSGSTSLQDNPIYYYLKGILKFLAAGVGLAVTGGIIFGGYLYITARANAGQVEKGKTVIINSIIGLLLFVFMFAILQFIIPGGIFT